MTAAEELLELLELLEHSPDRNRQTHYIGCNTPPARPSGSLQGTVRKVNVFAAQRESNSPPAGNKDALRPGAAGRQAGRPYEHIPLPT